ncbi:uncharacterized protein LOC128518785 isoform X1 [Clarias gariepinus]|uniref:uncharacterized protein LOC128518785 isoform X1 n=1 Tax=Clarias gariepinus TaxID=13013 RepID=UPI00234D70FC|nr:uncharacterized protein LOC128518785 isoform X1 [Clarias gariepinus]
MGGIFLIVQLGLLITFVFTESSEEHTRPGKQLNLDLGCIIDYLTEMKCLLTFGQPENCSEYSLNVSRRNKMFKCDFDQHHASECECSFEEDGGFVSEENYTVNVLRWNKMLFTKIINTLENIKPVKPFNISVTETQNGNFLIFWDTNYTTEAPVFNSELIPQLTYYVEGNNDSAKSVTLTEGQMKYELIGKNLKSNSYYIVKVRVKHHETMFGDYSDPYRFTTPMSLRDKLRIIIPILCVILIICIFISNYFYNKIMTEWWDKIPTPNIATNFVKQVPNLLSFQNEYSPIHLDPSKQVHAGEKTWPVSSVVDIRGENSLNSLGKDGNSADVIYGQTGNESLEESSTHSELVKESLSTTLHQIPMSNSYYKNLKPNDDDCNVGSESGNSSGFSNKFYMFSLSENGQNPAVKQLINDFPESHTAIPPLNGNLEPIILTDFEYGPCTGLSGSENTTQTQFLCSSNDIVVVPGYQSVSDLADCPSTDQEFISSQNDVNLIMEKLNCSKNPQNIFGKNDIIQVENGYKDVQSLLQNAEEGKNLITEAEMKYPNGSAFHNSPGIQIDCSYHRV